MLTSAIERSRPFSSKSDCLPHLLSPGQIGTVHTKNRLIMSPMGISLKPAFVGDEINPRIVDFFEARARGGVGLMIISGAYTDERSRAYAEHGLGLWHDRFVPTLRRFVDRLHAHGAKVGLHLVHGGSYAPSALTGVQPVSASACFTNWLNRETPRELSESEIADIVEGFGKAVRRAKDAGFDLVEYNAASGYLIREFLCARTNKRTDRYGQDIEGRLAFFKEIVAASRQQVGSDYTLTAKISGDEYLPGGNGLKEAITIAKELEAWGINAINVAPAGHEASLPLTSGLAPKGAFLYLAQTIKREVRIPVITSHLGDVFLAEQAIADQKIDFVAMGRSLLADPELPAKITRGEFEDVRPCIRCQQGCYDRLFLEGEEITCLMNPAMGRESDFHVTRARRKKKVLVVGGGPAGMQAAAIAAERGHDVSLYEKDDHLGGQLLLSSVIPIKRDFADGVRYFRAQLTKWQVDVRLCTEVNAELVEREAPDVVVVATGAQPIVPPIKGLDQRNVFNAFEALWGRVTVGRRVVVIGGGGIGCEVAVHLAGLGSMEPETAVFLSSWGVLPADEAVKLTMRGRDVTILEMTSSVAKDVGMTTRGFLRKELSRRGVQVITGATATAITDRDVKFEDRDGKTQSTPCDTVVIAVGTKSSSSIYDELKGKVPELYLIGDAKQPRKALDAIREATVLGRDI